MDGLLNARDFGTPDNPATLASALDAANTAGTGVYLSPGTWAAGILHRAYAPKIIGADASLVKIEQTDYTDDMWKFSGSRGAAKLLTVDVAENGRVLQVDTTGITAGDILLLGDNTRIRSDTANRFNGQAARVISVDSPTQLTIKEAAFKGYTVADGAFIAKWNPIKDVVIKGVQFVNPTPAASTKTWLTIEHAIDVELDVDGLGAGHVALALWHCYRFRVRTKAVDYVDDPPNYHYAYGVSVAGASAHGTVDVLMDTGRHGFATNWRDGDYGHPYNIIVRGLTTGASAAGFNTHAAGNVISFADVHAVDNIGKSAVQEGAGLDIRSPNTVVNGGIVNQANAGVIIRENAHNSIVQNLLIQNVRRLNGMYGNGIATLTPLTRIALLNNTIRKIGCSGFRANADISHLMIKGGWIDTWGMEGIGGERGGVRLNPVATQVTVQNVTATDVVYDSSKYFMYMDKWATGAADVVFKDNTVYGNIPLIYDELRIADGSGNVTIANSDAKEVAV